MKRCVTCARLRSPSRRQSSTRCFTLSVPLTMRPIARGPRYASGLTSVTRNWRLASGSPFGAGTVLTMASKMGRRSVSWLAQVRGALAIAGDGVEDGELDLVLVGVEVDEQVVDLVQHLLGAGVLAVDLVDDDDGHQAERERLREHEPRLRQRPLGGVDEEHDAVHHAERALHLAAEVGVAGRVDDVDLDLSPAWRVDV